MAAYLEQPPLTNRNKWLDAHVPRHISTVWHSLENVSPNFWQCRIKRRKSRDVVRGTKVVGATCQHAPPKNLHPTPTPTTSTISFSSKSANFTRNFSRSRRAEVNSASWTSRSSSNSPRPCKRSFCFESLESCQFRELSSQRQLVHRKWICVSQCRLAPTDCPHGCGERVN